MPFLKSCRLKAGLGADGKENTVLTPSTTPPSAILSTNTIAGIGTGDAVPLKAGNETRARAGVDVPNALIKTVVPVEKGGGIGKIGGAVYFPD